MDIFEFGGIVGAGDEVVVKHFQDEHLLRTNRVYSNFDDQSHSEVLRGAGSTVTWGPCPAHVVQWSNHLGAMCSRA